jgi:urate oxidase
LPDRGHFPVDLSAFGLSNEAEVFMPSDEPFGPVEATIRRRS